MEMDPMEMKIAVTKQAIKDLKSEDKKLRVMAATALGVVIKVSENPTSEKEALDSLRQALEDAEKAVRKAAERALNGSAVKGKDMKLMVGIVHKVLEKSENKEFR